MKTVEIAVTKRQDMTKNELSRFRKTGNIPAILYGKHLDNNFPISIDSSVFSKTLKSLGRTVLLEFKSDDSDLNKRSALIKEIQRNCLNDNILHVDLMEIKQNEEISLDVKLNFVGTPIGVKNSGGILDILKRSINVTCLPSKIPDLITIDLSGLDIGSVVHISDLEIPEGVVITDSTSLALVSVNLPKVVKAQEELETVEEEAAAASPKVDTDKKEEKTK